MVRIDREFLLLLDCGPLEEEEKYDELPVFPINEIRTLRLVLAMQYLIDNVNETDQFGEIEDISDLCDIDHPLDIA